MYIKQVKIQNIRSITHFEMNFEVGKEAGWHVLLGENGSGKSSVVRAIALALLGLKDVYATREDWSEWLQKGQKEANISLQILPSSVDNALVKSKKSVPYIDNSIRFTKNGVNIDVQLNPNKKKPDPTNYNWGNGYGWFSASYGPFRRFSGGNPDKEKIFTSNPKLGAHWSLFGEDIALSEAIPFLKTLYTKKLESNGSNSYLDDLKKFINQGQLLPHESLLDEVNSEGVFFKDGSGKIVPALQMSEGFRSILSMTFELLRQLVRVYGLEKVFENTKNGHAFINLPGVVMIDEIDVHLHPTWQAKVGFWFLKYFPNIQFIVTTHSPLVCRAAEKGSIWQLWATGNGDKSALITGTTRDRLLYGNVIDAYGTDIFGKETSISADSTQKKVRLSELSIKSMEGTLNSTEQIEYDQLTTILSTRQLTRK